MTSTGRLALVALAVLCFLAVPVTAERTGSGTAADPFIDTYSKYDTTEHAYTQNLIYYDSHNPIITPTSFRNYPSEAVDPVSMMVFTSYNLITASGTFTFNGTEGEGRWASTTLDDPEYPGYPGFLILRFDTGAYNGEYLTINGTWPITGRAGYLSYTTTYYNAVWTISITPASFGFAQSVSSWGWSTGESDYHHNGGQMGVAGNYIYSIATAATDDLRVYCYEDGGFRKTDVWNNDTPADIYIFYDDILLASSIDDPGTDGTPLHAEYLADFRPGASTYANTYLRRPLEWVNYTYAFPVPPVRPSAGFTATPTTGDAPLTVQFTDTSTGDPTAWAWEFGDGWGSYARNPAHIYAAPGTYTVILTAYNDAGSDVRTRTGYITVTAPEPTGSAIVNGYVYDTTNDVFVDGATVTVRNDTYSTTATSSGGGYYLVANLTPGTYTVKGQKAGYVASPDYAVSLTDGAVVRQDVALGVSGVAIVGTVYDAVTGAPLDAVAVTATQGSGNVTTVSADGGKYTLNDLSTGIDIAVSAVLSGYTHNTVTISPSHGGPYTVDLYLVPDAIDFNGTALGGVVTGTQGQAIVGATVVLGTGQNATTSPTGWYQFDDLAPGNTFVSATASGYTASAQIPVLLVNETFTRQDIALTSASTPSTGFGSVYPAHNVRFHCIDDYGAPLPGVTISAAYVETTSPLSWLTDLLGISSSVEIENTTLQGTTGTDGSIVFSMVETVQYALSAHDPASNLSVNFTIYPQETQYTIQFRTRPAASAETYPIYILEAVPLEGDTQVSLRLAYNDRDNATTSLSFWVKNDAGEYVYTDTPTLHLLGWTNTSYTVENHPTSYTWGFDAQHATRGEISAARTITLHGSGRLVDLGFEDDFWYFLLSALWIIGIGALFSGSQVRFGAIIIPLIGGGIPVLIGWLPVSTAVLVGVLTFIGVFVYMRKSEYKLYR